MADILSKRTQRLVEFDLMRYQARLKIGRQVFETTTDKLHLGCQAKKIEGWLNVDVIASDLDIDLGGGYLPFKNGVFKSVVCQHTIEHLDLQDELIPLLKEIKRICAPQAEIWLSCPDIGKLCKGYVADKGVELLEGKRRRYKYDHGSLPPQHVINSHFYQDGEHQNLFDFDLLRWTLHQVQLENVKQVDEQDFLTRFPEFPKADDEDHSLYVRVIV